MFKNVVCVLVILIFSFAINSCRKVDIPVKNQEKIEAYEIENIKNSIKSSLKNVNGANLNPLISNGLILNYASPFDTTYLGIIVPIYFKDKNIVKGLLNLKINKKNEIIEETIYGKDEKLSLEHLERFEFCIGFLEKNDFQFQDNLKDQVLRNQSVMKDKINTSTPQLTKKSTNSTNQVFSFTLGFGIELYWVSSCSQSEKIGEMAILQDELRSQIESYVGRECNDIGAQIIFYDFSLANVRIKVNSAVRDPYKPPFGELSTELGAKSIISQWIRFGPITKQPCLGNGNMEVYIRNYIGNVIGGSTPGSPETPGTPGTPGTGNNPIPLPTFLNFVAGKPYVLIPEIPCNVIQNWISTAKFTPSGNIIDRLNQLSATPHIVPGLNSPIVARIQNIDNAYSSVVNMDYFSVKVSKLPSVGGEQMSAENFLQMIRVNINGFIDQNRSKFTPYSYYGVDDNDLWNSPNPLGAILGIDIPGPDNGSVIVSKSSSTGWTFTTINDPKYHDHPVSGNRDFGFQQNSDGSYTFFTRGVDRITNWDGTLLQEIAQTPFTQADILWSSFQGKIANFVNQNQGNATINIPVTHRPDWSLVKAVMDGERPLSDLSTNCN